MRLLPSGAIAMLLTWTGLTARGDELQERLQRDLFTACSNSDGNIAQIKKLLAKGASASLPSEDYGRLPLHEAIRNGHYDVVRLLVEHGASLNQPSALSVAAAGVVGNWMGTSSKSHTKKMVELLLSLGADVRAEDDEPITAAAGNSLEVVQQLIAVGGRPTRRALVNAVTSGHVDIVEFLVKAGIDPLSNDSEGRALLHDAAASFLYGSTSGEALLAASARLLAFGVSVNARDKDGRTPLFEAATDLMTAWLIDKKAKLNLKDQSGRTALMVHAGRSESGYAADILRVLLKGGADLNARDQDGETALDYAADAESWGETRLLLEAGAEAANAAEILKHMAHASLERPVPKEDVSVITARLLPHITNLQAMDVDGLPMLSWTVMIDNPSVARLLLKAGVKVNAADAEGRTPLMLAFMTGNDTIRDLLIDAGADPERKNNLGQAARDMNGFSKVVSPFLGEADASPLPVKAAVPNDIFAAIADGQLEEVKRLIAGDPNLLTQKRGGIQPLHLAFALGHREMVEALIAAGSSLDAKTSDQSSCLTVAAMAGRMELMRWLLQRADIFERDSMMSELSGLWSVEGNYFSFKLALEADWQPEKHEDAQKALRLAVQHDDLPTLRTLLRFGASLSPVRETKDDPFHGTRAPNLLLLASEHRSPKLLRFLLDEIAAHLAEWRADVTEALLAAVKSGRVEVVRLLVERGGADVSVGGPPQRDGPDHFVGKTMATPLCVAVENAHSEVVKYLLEKSATLDGNDSRGRPILASAVSTGDIELVRLMLANGAELEAKGTEERTALHEAASRGLTEITDFLISKGARQDAKDKMGRTPAQLAESEGRPFP